MATTLFEEVKSILSQLGNGESSIIITKPKEVGMDSFRSTIYNVIRTLELKAKVNSEGKGFRVTLKSEGAGSRLPIVRLNEPSEELFVASYLMLQAEGVREVELHGLEFFPTRAMLKKYSDDPDYDIIDAVWGVRFVRKSLMSQQEKILKELDEDDNK